MRPTVVRATTILTLPAPGFVLVPTRHWTTARARIAEVDAHDPTRNPQSEQVQRYVYSPLMSIPRLWNVEVATNRPQIKHWGVCT